MDSIAVKELASACGVDVVGVLDAASAPVQSQFDWVKSFIVLGYATPDESLDAVFRTERNGMKKSSKWIYEVIETRALRLCMKLRDLGFKAEATKKINLVKAGAAAGLGALSKNLMLVTKKFGPRLRLIAVATDAAIEADRPFQEGFCNDCELCIDNCPTGALTRDGFDKGKCVRSAIAPAKKLTRFVNIPCRECMTVCPVGNNQAGDENKGV